MKNFQLFFLILLLTLGTQTLKANNYDYFSAFDGIDAAKSKMAQDGFTDHKLIFIGAYESILDGIEPNEANNGKILNWYYTFVCNNDSRLLTLGVIKQNNQLITAIFDDCPSYSKPKIPFFSNILTDFREIPLDLIDSDSITIEIFNQVSKINTGNFNQGISTSIWRIEIASKENLEKDHLQSTMNEDYLWEVELGITDSNILGSGTDAAMYYISALTGETLEYKFTVGVEDDNLPQYFSIFPNPASDFITIQFPTSVNFETSEVQKVQIFNTLGIEVGQSSLIDDKNRIDISHLPTGVYFIKIGDKVEKFVKM